MAVARVDGDVTACATTIRYRRKIKFSPRRGCGLSSCEREAHLAAEDIGGRVRSLLSRFRHIDLGEILYLRGKRDRDEDEVNHARHGEIQQPRKSRCREENGKCERRFLSVGERGEKEKEREREREKAARSRRWNERKKKKKKTRQTIISRRRSRDEGNARVED